MLDTTWAHEEDGDHMGERLDCSEFFRNYELRDPLIWHCVLAHQDLNPNAGQSRGNVHFSDPPVINVSVQSTVEAGEVLQYTFTSDRLTPGLPTSVRFILYNQYTDHDSDSVTPVVQGTAIPDNLSRDAGFWCYDNGRCSGVGGANLTYYEGGNFYSRTIANFEMPHAAAYYRDVDYYEGIIYLDNSDIDGDATRTATLSIPTQAAGSVRMLLPATPNYSITDGNFNTGNNVYGQYGSLVDTTVTDHRVLFLSADKDTYTEGEEIRFSMRVEPTFDSHKSYGFQQLKSQDGDFLADTHTAQFTLFGTFVYPASTVDDDVDEPDGTVTLTVPTHDDYNIFNNMPSLTVNILDNDLPEVSITGPATGTVGEELTYTISVVQHAESTTTVTYAGVQDSSATVFPGIVQGGTLVGTVDVTGSGSATVSFVPVNSGNIQMWVNISTSYDVDSSAQAVNTTISPARAGAQDGGGAQQQAQQSEPTNLILNGSFESPTVTEWGGTWQHFATTTDGIGWDASGGILELHRGILGGASDGQQHTELDVDGSAAVTISQAVVTIPGQTYEISFDYKARPGEPSHSNGVTVSWNGTNVTPTIVFGNTWKTATVQVTGTGTDTISFTDTGTVNGRGTFLDNVSVMLSQNQQEQYHQEHVEIVLPNEPVQPVEVEPVQLPVIPVNLLVNPSFESPTVTANEGTWEHVSTTTDGIGWSATGGKLELQREILGGASDGAQHLELDVDGSSAVTISQTVTTVQGQTYEISFDYKSRPGEPTNSNGVTVSWSGTDVTPTISFGNTWQTATVQVTGTGSDTISFTDTGTVNGRGTFLDNVSVMIVP